MCRYLLVFLELKDFYGRFDQVGAMLDMDGFNIWSPIMDENGVAGKQM